MKISNAGMKAGFALFLCLFLLLPGCARREKITSLDQLADKTFAVVTGTVADQLVLSRFPKARLTYYNSALDACLAVKNGRADAAGYDEPILKNIAAKQPGLVVLPERVTTDQYGFAVRQDDPRLKEAIDSVVVDLKKSGAYDAMVQRWLPRSGSPEPMPRVDSSGGQGTLRFGTAAVTEPFAFVDGSGNVVGLDVELASYVAKKTNRKLEVVNMDFGALIPALIAGKVDMIGACITITGERAKRVLFSEPYYTGGISALVRE
ncbi:MAG: transporter substrate-binding domain-containing protein [Bacteroidota bacterium]